MNLRYALCFLVLNILACQAQTGQHLVHDKAPRPEENSDLLEAKEEPKPKRRVESKYIEDLPVSELELDTFPCAMEQKGLHGEKELQHFLVNAIKNEGTAPNMSWSLLLEQTQVTSHYMGPSPRHHYEYTHPIDIVVESNGISFRVSLISIFHTKGHLTHEGKLMTSTSVIATCAKTPRSHELHGKIYLIEKSWNPDTKSGVARFFLIPNQ